MHHSALRRVWDSMTACFWDIYPLDSLPPYPLKPTYAGCHPAASRSGEIYGWARLRIEAGKFLIRPDLSDFALANFPSPFFHKTCGVPAFSY